LDGNALRRGEERRLARAFGDRDRDAVEELRGAREYVEMSVSDRVECARVDAVAHERGRIESKGLGRGDGVFWE
jgi:hypothetical protein